MPWVMKPGGACVRGAHNHPEAYTVLAPKHFQKTCLAIGGLNRNGKPMFRLIEARSRLRVGGGADVRIRDNSGNVVKTEDTELFIPRYPLPKELPGWRDADIPGCFVLERWTPPEWYEERGLGGTEDFVFIAGKWVRQQEPIWPEGNYEAVQANVVDPLFIKRTISCAQLEQLIHMALETEARKPDENSRIQLANHRLEEDQQFDTMKEQIRDAIGPFGVREWTSMHGPKSCKF